MLWRKKVCVALVNIEKVASAFGLDAETFYGPGDYPRLARWTAIRENAMINKLTPSELFAELQSHPRMIKDISYDSFRQRYYTFCKRHDKDDINDLVLPIRECVRYKFDSLLAVARVTKLPASLLAKSPKRVHRGARQTIKNKAIDKFGKETERYSQHLLPAWL